MEQSFKIKYWGTRGSTPCANTENMLFGGNTTCVQIFIPDSEELLILDCGTGFRNMGNTLQAKNTSHKGKIFITHPHWDHLQGFPFFKPFYDNRNQFKIYLPPQGISGCKEIIQGHMTATFFPVSMDMLEADLQCETFREEKKVFDEYSIEYMWAHHTIPTAMFKLVINDTVVVFAPDNELPMDSSGQSESFLENFAAFIHGVDVLIHDAQYDKEKYRDRQGWGHSAWELITEMAEREQVKNLHLIHHDPDNDDEYLSELNNSIQSRYKNSFDGVCLIKEGQEINLPCTCKHQYKNVVAT